MTARVHFQRVGYRIALWFLAWIFIVLIDPIASYSFVASKSAKLVSQVSAPFYGIGKSLQRDSIAVVVLTADDRHAYQSFPLTADEYGDILAGIVARGPRAVFVDVQFDVLHQDQPQFVDRVVGALVRTLGVPPAKPVPLIFGMGPPAQDKPPVSNDVATQVSQYITVGHAATWHTGDADVYQLRQAAGTDERPGHDSAALAVYRLICTDGDCPNEWPERYQRDLALQWGVQPPPSSKGRPDCWRGGDGLSGRAGLAAKIAFGGGLPGLAFLFGMSDLTQPCRYHEELSVGDLDVHWQTADQVLKDRVVFFGQVSEADALDTPFGPVAGVYVHAMALDNLLTYGSAYYRDLGKWVSDVPVSRAVTGVLWVALSLVFAIAIEWPNRFVKPLAMIKRPFRRWRPHPRLTDGLIAIGVGLVLLAVDLKLRWRFSELLVFSAMVPILYELARKNHKRGKVMKGSVSCLLGAAILSAGLSGPALAQAPAGPPVPGFRSQVVNVYTREKDGTVHPNGQSIDLQRRYFFSGSDPGQAYVQITDGKAYYLVRRGAIAWDPAQLPQDMQSCSRIPTVVAGRSLGTNGLGADQCRR